MSPDRKPRAVIYARYSSEMQRENSIEDQLRICRRLADDRGFEVVEVYTDKGISGATQLRPGYQALVQAAGLDGFDVVIAESIDRISRDQEHIAHFYKAMTYQGIQILTIAEGEINELHIGLKGTMSALYLKDLAQKTHRGLEGRVREGKSAGGLSYGYKNDRRLLPDQTFTTGERVIDQKEAKIVRRIFQEYANGDSARTIAARLNAEAVPGPRGKLWNYSTISGNWRRGIGILNNELYIGKLVWNRQRFVKDPTTHKRQARPNPPEQWIIEEVPDLRIVDQALWDAVKQRQGVIRQDMKRTTSKSRPEQARRPKYLFSGLLKCGCCGAGYTLMNKTKYGCSANRNRGTCDNRKLIHREEVEDRVLAGLKTKLLHPDLIAEFVAEFQREYNRLMKDQSSERDAAEKELGKINNQIARIVDAIAEGMMHASMRDKLTELEERKTELNKALQKMGKDKPIRLHPGLADIYRRKVADLTAALNQPETRTQAAEILRGLISEIRLTPSGKGHDIELVGELAAIMALDGAKNKKAQPEAGQVSETMVAGVGFEPTTFRL